MDPAAEQEKPKYGTPAYWIWFNSPEQIRVRQDEQTAKEDDELAREGANDWWDVATADVDRWSGISGDT